MYTFYIIYLYMHIHITSLRLGNLFVYYFYLFDPELISLSLLATKERDSYSQ
jgi:hypothetical protein